MKMFNRILTCAFCFQHWMTVKLIFTVIRVLWIFNAGAIGPVYSQGKCPSTEKLQDVSFACFNTYSAQKINLEKSGRQLYSGINIEILRAYCSAYLDGMTCIGALLDTCPERARKDIKAGISHLKGTEQELADLCSTQELYEIYSQHMGCFLERGQKSEWCVSSNVNSVTYSRPKEEFCRHVRGATQCVENTIRHGCGEKAAELVHKLVKPTIRNSGTCTYDIQSSDTSAQPTDYQDGTNQPRGGSTDPGKRNAANSSKHNATLSLSCNVLLIALAINISILSYLSNTFKFTRVS